MPADQAAGLRRRSALLPLRCLHVFSDSAESSPRLAQALHRRGSTVLLVDAAGRLFAGSPARSLFDWRQQLARGQMQCLPMEYGDGWFAPGVRADAPALAGVAHNYDAVVFDGGGEGELALTPGVAYSMIIEVNAARGSMQRAYALLKTLFRLGEAVDVALLGEAAACDRIQAACAHFLDARYARALFNAAHEDDAFAALAVRMAGEGTSPGARDKTGNT